MIQVIQGITGPWSYDILCEWIPRGFVDPCEPYMRRQNCLAKFLEICSSVKRMLIFFAQNPTTIMYTMSAASSCTPVALRGTIGQTYHSLVIAKNIPRILSKVISNDIKWQETRGPGCIDFSFCHVVSCAFVASGWAQRVVQRRQSNGLQEDQHRISVTCWHWEQSSLWRLQHIALHCTHIYTLTFEVQRSILFRHCTHTHIKLLKDEEGIRRRI